MFYLCTDVSLLPFPLEESSNEVFFQEHMRFSDLTTVDFDIIQDIDGAIKTGNRFMNQFGLADLKHLSTGCKTVINILHNTHKCFNLVECGSNAIVKLIRICESGSSGVYAFMSDYRELHQEDISFYLNNKLIKGATEFYNAWRVLEREVIYDF